MSDQNGTTPPAEPMPPAEAAPPVPPQPPAPEPPAYAPPAPPAAPQPAYAPPAYAPPAAPAPVKKSKKGLVIGIVIAIVVLLLLCCGGMFGFIAYQAAQEAAAYERAATILEKASGKMEDTDLPDASEDAQAFVDVLEPAVAEYRTAIQAARKEIEPLSDSEDKTKALNALQALEGAMDTLDELSTAVVEVDATQAEVEAMYKDIEAGDAALNESVKANNADRHADGEAQAQAAMASFTAAMDKANQLDKKLPGVGFADVVSIISIKRGIAEKDVRMSQLGKQGNVNTYNKLIDEVDELRKQIDALPDPAFESDPDLLMGDLNKLVEQLERAGEEADKAVETLKGLAG